MWQSCLSLLMAFLITPTPGTQTTSNDKPNLDGTWEITAMLDDGKFVTPQQIHEQFIQNRRITIAGQTMTVLMPGAAQPKLLVFVVDYTKSPYTFDVAGTEKAGSKGIVVVSGDTLMICLGDPENKERPAGFVSTPQSKTMLLTLQRVKAETAAFKPVAQQTAATPKSTTPEIPTIKITPTTPMSPAAPTATAPMLTEAQMRTMLVGTWGHQTKDAINYVTLNADGSMSAVRNWKSSFKKTFSGPERSSGTWKLQDGVVVIYINASTEKERRNQVYSYRIRTLTATEVICVDQTGQLRREWKVSQ